MTTAAPRSTPPTAKRVSLRHELHGDARDDDYYWLRDREDPDTLRYLEAENEHADAATAHLAGLRETLYGEMLARVKQDDEEAPYPWGGWLYYYRTAEGKQYRLYCRSRPGGPEQVILDLNEIAREHGYVRLYALEPSPDHSLLAYSVDTSGNEEMSVRVKDLATGAVLPDCIENATFGLEWANDNRTLFYCGHDASKRADKVMRHVLGTDAASDVVVLREDDERYSLGLERTASGRYLRLRSAGKVSSEEWLLDADRPGGEAWLF
ncbi:MAG TPA: hypothetical protein VNT60_09910, partial [Deinococcales bacterium]|nr:hypothetical protein [Deinococcales bacterium]